MNTATYWILFAPLGLVLAYFLNDHPPSFIESRTWENSVWGVSGITILWATEGIMKSLRAANVTTLREAKVFNEQVKLMSSTLNAVALAFLVVAIVQPTSNNMVLSLKDGLLVLLGLFLHTRTYLILDCMKADP